MNDNEMRTRVQAIRGHIDTLSRSVDELMADLDGEFVQVPRNGRWTKPMVAQLWERCRHLPGVVALFEVTAARPNEEVTLSEVLARSGLDPRQQSNEHARMSRIAAELFEEKRWPIHAWQGSSAHDGQMLYRMGGTVADWWKDITA